MDGKVVTKKDIQVRLRRIEGQIKGIEKMIDCETCCKDVLIQIAAVRAAINKVGGLMLQNYAKSCFISECDKSSEEKKIEELVSTLTMFLK
ncbi:DNA-binding FrmR family transcriptional regulator [Clostridium algifaecis]|uniref:DNA-binding FrmR family transcriptional regulator n=1 Tax=Clostridium algifaecis TaxID=1472040 RepID=A0ABS4KPS5_9CLOT|nr:metal-sensitive transcriptional regulator [Clostridium algifaecis]MBP2032035.1 DNA-binding FrmR family transcriptional regulator [Clostridium algifaecis]